MNTVIPLRPAIAARRRRQSGISLIIVLVLLVVMSLLGIVVLRSSAMQERMSANMRDRSLAMQGAETALRFAQAELAVAPDPMVPNDTWENGKIPTAGDCTNFGICPTGSVATWRTLPAGSFDNELSAAPEYWIEYLGTGPGYKGSCDEVEVKGDCQSPMYRITARSSALGRAEVVLQSNVISRIPSGP